MKGLVFYTVSRKEKLSGESKVKITEKLLLSIETAVRTAFI